MAAVLEVSPSTVMRHWQANGLKPHLVRGFKISRDPKSIEKLEDIVGLYMFPPEHALVLCCDEKSQVQALDRTQPGLPLKKGRAQTMTQTTRAMARPRCSPHSMCWTVKSSASASSDTRTPNGCAEACSPACPNSRPQSMSTSLTTTPTPSRSSGPRVLVTIDVDAELGRAPTDGGAKYETRDARWPRSCWQRRWPTA